MDKKKKGAFIISRDLFESELWLKKPATWTKVWIYILGRVNHKKTKLFERGENFFQFPQEYKLIGSDVTLDKIKKFLSFARKNSIISTKRSTRGVTIKVLNYDEYQDLKNYTSTTSRTKKALRKHEESTTINKNEKNEKNEKNILCTGKALADPQMTKDIVEVFNQFKQQLNPVINFGHKTNRKDAEYLIKQIGLTKVLEIIRYAESLQGTKYAPTITTPSQLRSKFGELMAFYKKENNATNNKVSKIEF